MYVPVERNYEMLDLQFIWVVAVYLGCIKILKTVKRPLEFEYQYLVCDFKVCCGLMLIFNYSPIIVINI